MDDQGKRQRKREGDDVVGEREEKEGSSQVLPPLCHSVFSDDDLDKVEGPSQVMPPSSLFVSKSVFDHPDSDGFLVDLAPCESGVDYLRPLDPEALKRYNQQIDESEGFDIFYFPGPSVWTPIVPVTDIKESPLDYEAAVNLAKLAITEYNVEHDEAYEFVDLEAVNARVVSGCVYYITFQVKNLKAAGNGNVDGDGTPLKTFQARVWEGITETEVELCRPKPIKLQN